MMVSRGLADQTDIILGPSYKGSAIALSTAIALYSRYGRDLLFDYDRKEAKTHGESSKSGSLFVNKTFFDGCRVFVVDDVATSMGTKQDLLKTVEQEAKAGGIAVKLVGIGIAIDREQTTAVYDPQGRVVPGKKGKNAIHDFVASTGIPVHSVAGIREVIEFLYSTGVPVKVEGRFAAMSEKTKQEFDEYLRTYGVE
jgi:orotate phosphoribosyltransferase